MRTFLPGSKKPVFKEKILVLNSLTQQEMFTHNVRQLLHGNQRWFVSIVLSSLWQKIRHEYQK